MGDAHSEGPLALRELGPASTIGRQQTVGQTSEVAPTRSGILGVALQALLGLAIRVGDRTTGNGHPLATPRIHTVLEVEIPKKETWLGTRNGDAASF